jgi:hypothetical protein
MEDLLKTAKEILSTVAPTVATALGGPLGGVAVKSLINILGLDPATPEKEVLEKVTNADPEMLFKFKQLEQDFALQMKKLQVNVQELNNANLDSARNREIQLKDNTNKYLAYIVTGLYIAIQLWLVSGHILPQEMREIVMRALGTLDAIIAMVFGYYYGSSIDKTKNDR